MELIQERNNSKISIHKNSYAVKNHNLHWHENIEVCIALNQPCRFWVDGVLVEASPGDLIIIGEGMIHRFIIEHDDTQIRLLQFSSKILLKAGISVKQLKIHLTAKEIGQMPEVERQMNVLLDMIEGEGRLHKEKENPYQEYLICALYCLLKRNFVDETDGNSTKTERQEFYRIVSYVNEHFDEEININTLAEELFLYRAKVSSIFAKYAGMSIKEYINILRVNKANMLMNQGYGISQAAMESGFGCIRTFNQIYKKLTGITPSSYVNKVSTPGQRPLVAFASLLPTNLP